MTGLGEMPAWKHCWGAGVRGRPELPASHTFLHVGSGYIRMS